MSARELRRWMVAGALLVCVAAFGQQAPSSPSQLPDAPQAQPGTQRPQAQPPPAPPADESSQAEKKPESKVKKTLKRGAPDCIQIFGVQKCREAKDEEGESGQAAPPPRVPENAPMPRSDSGESSSKGPAKLPPMPGAEPAEAREVPYNPHRADKDVEVGDFYFKRGNWRAAESRYAGALTHMPNHAAAIYKLALTEEKLGKTAQARANYQKYLKILPDGEYAARAKQALARLQASTSAPPAQKSR